MLLLTTPTKHIGGRRGLVGVAWAVKRCILFSDVDSSTSPGGGGYIKLGKGEELRHVERDVIIPNKILCRQ